MPITDQKVYMLTLLKTLDIRKRHRYGLYKCHCGIEKEIRMDHVKSGRISSCGSNEHRINHSKTHGLSYTRQYRSCNDARRRCEDPRRPNYNDYGGRGIKFLFDSIEDCAKCLGDPPYRDDQIDRIDNDGDYVYNNIKWSSRSQNNKNRRKF